MRWQSEKGDRVVSWGGGRFLFYPRVWNAGRVQDFIFLYLMLINGTQGVDFLACPQGWKDTPKILLELSKAYWDLGRMDFLIASFMADIV